MNRRWPIITKLVHITKVHHYFPWLLSDSRSIVQRTAVSRKAGQPVPLCGIRWCERRTPSVFTGGAVYSISNRPFLFLVFYRQILSIFSIEVLPYHGAVERGGLAGSFAAFGFRAWAGGGCKCAWQRRDGSVGLDGRSLYFVFSIKVKRINHSAIIYQIGEMDDCYKEICDYSKEMDD